MNTLFAGLDVSTQSCKLVVIDAGAEAVVFVDDDEIGGLSAGLFMSGHIFKKFGCDKTGVVFEKQVCEPKVSPVENLP